MINYFINDTGIRFIDQTDPSDPTRREDFQIDALKTHYPQGLSNIDPYHQLFIVFVVLLVSTVFTENVYFCSVRMFFFFEFFIYGLFLFAISSLVREITMLSSQKILSSASSSFHLSACSVLFVYVQLLLRTLFLLTLIQ